MRTSSYPRAVDEAVVAQLLGSSVVDRRRVTGGYSPAERWVVRLADGRSAFVKVGVSESTAAFLRTEARVYAELRAPFMATVLGWHDGA